MATLSDYPILLDGTKLPWPTAWSESSGVVENVNRTEAGTDLVTVTRYDKLTVDLSFDCTASWAGKFKAWSKKDSLTVQMYDVELGGYRSRSMRMRDLKVEPVGRSWLTRGTTGLWSVSFTLEEF